MTRIYLYEKELKQTDDDEVPVIVYIDREMFQILKENEHELLNIKLNECQINVNYEDGIYIE